MQQVANKENFKICLVGSSGGHLTHLYMLKPFWKEKNRFWVTFNGPLWYIFALYMYLVISSICMSRWPRLSTKLGWLIIIRMF